VSSAVFHTGGSSDAHNITIEFLNSIRSGFQKITLLADTGSDLTLIKREDGERLGFNPDKGGEGFLVGGVGAGAVPFKKFQTPVKIQNLSPTMIDFGVAINHGQLRDNLLGREDILDVYDVTYSKNMVCFTPGQRMIRTMHAWNQWRYNV